MTKTRILQKYPPRMENVLLILHELQSSNPHNYLSKKDLRLAAAYLNATLATIFGIASYYTMFSLTPRGKHIIRICRSPVCFQAGAMDVFAELNRLLMINIGETTTDQRFTLESAACLGQCDAAPAMMVDDNVYGNLTRDTIAAVIRHYGGSLRRAKRPEG